MKKLLKKQQVEKMFREDMMNIKIEKNNEKLIRQIYWTNLLLCLYQNRSITPNQYKIWSEAKI